MAVFGYLILIYIDFCDFITPFSPLVCFRLRRYIKHSGEFLKNISRHVEVRQKNTPPCLVFLTLFSVFGNVFQHGLSCLIYYWCPARQISPSTNVVTKKCKIYCSLFNASLFDLNSIPTDGPDNSIPQPFPTAVHLCATYAPYTQETKSGLQNLCNRAGILMLYMRFILLSIPFHRKDSRSECGKAVVYSTKVSAN